MKANKMWAREVVHIANPGRSYCGYVLFLGSGVTVFSRTRMPDYHQGAALHAAGTGSLNRLSIPMTPVITVSAPPIYCFARK
jgi:hypothetical protein